jgi:hypothetical protein
MRFTGSAGSAKNTRSPERRFLFKLAPHLGMTVTHLERVLPYREFLEWAEEYRLDPWGTWRDNAHAAEICTVIANAFRSEKSRAFTYEDFMIVDPETAEKIREKRRRAANSNLVSILNSMAS